MMLSSELDRQHREVEHFMAEKGLGYTAWRNYEAHQVLVAAGDASNYRSTVIARVRDGDRDYFSWGFYPRDEAEAVAKKIKRIRKHYILDVTIVDSARRV
jgi:hypothetical protein